MAAATSHFPVVVVGSGPVGLTLANLLGVQGVGTLIVERNQTTVQEPRAVSIDDESLRTMQAAGVVAEVLAHVVAGYGSHYYSPRRIRFARVEPTGRPYGYPRRNAFRQPLLEAQLKAALGRFDHVETAYGWVLDHYEQSPMRVTLALTGPDGTVRRITCDQLVGCDGAASRVREQQGIPLEGTTFDERWLIVDLEGHENTTRHTEVFCDERRPCITLPGPGRTRRFEFKLKPDEREADLLAPPVVEQLLRAHGADPNATIRRKVVYRFHARMARQWSFGRVHLAGDAAHLTPPFAGQGMNSGIRDAHNLAWKIAAVLDDRLGARLLGSYERERKDHVWQMVQLALRMGRVMSPRTRLRGLLTQSALLALNVWPPARDYIAQMKYKPPPRFHAGFLIPDAQGRRSLVGRLLPQPMVRTPDGIEVLLDEVLGIRFVLLMRSVRAVEDLRGLRQPVWDALGAVRVAVLPAGAAPQASPGIQVVMEADETLQAAVAPYPGCAFLLRPDHYVLMTIPLAKADAASRAAEALVADTWNAPQRGTGGSPRARQGHRRQFGVGSKGLPALCGSGQRPD